MELYECKVNPRWLRRDLHEEHFKVFPILRQTGRPREWKLRSFVQGLEHSGSSGGIGSVSRFGHVSFTFNYDPCSLSIIVEI